MGSFAAIYLGVQGYLAGERGAADWRDTAAAGGFTAGLFGLLSACARGAAAQRASQPRALTACPRARAVPRGMLPRLHGMALGVGTGAGLGAPLGALQASLAAQLAAHAGSEVQQSPPPAPPAGAAEAAIRHLSASLDDDA